MCAALLTRALARIAGGGGGAGGAGGAGGGALASALLLRSGRRAFARVAASELRAGDCVELDDAVVYRVEAQHFQRMGMGRAYKQVTLRAVRSGLKKEVRFRVDEDVEQVELDRPQALQVLYVEGETLALMDPVSFEQHELPLALLGAQAPFVQAGMALTLQSYQGQPASATLPPKVVLEVAEVTPLPGGSAKESRDIPAVCTNGVRVKVPKFTKVGDRILVDTRLETLGAYVGKASDEDKDGGGGGGGGGGGSAGE
jgi:elongation factor P